MLGGFFSAWILMAWCRLWYLASSSPITISCLLEHWMNWSKKGRLRSCDGFYWKGNPIRSVKPTSNLK